MTYARSRLWLGITTVGFWVVLASVALIGGWPSRWLPTTAAAPAIEILSLLSFFLLYTLLGLPSDLWGGWILPRRHGRSGQEFGPYLARWVRGALTHGVVLTLIALAVLIGARAAGTLLALAIVLVVSVGLLAAQALLGRWTGALVSTSVGTDELESHLRDWRVDPGRVELWKNRDPGFTGGIVGLPGREHVVLPVTWLARMGSEATAVHLVRRLYALRSGARGRGVALALTWNAGGFVLATRLPEADLVSVSGLVTVALGTTLWSFLGLLLLPSLSRPAAFCADRAARELGVPDAALQRALSVFDRMQDDEPSRSPWVERIFHPLPSLESRRAHLRGDAPPPGAWNAARLTLFLSWATLGLLSRAVHCNTGRPELWVLLPAD